MLSFKFCFVIKAIISFLTDFLFEPKTNILVIGLTFMCPESEIFCQFVSTDTDIFFSLWANIKKKNSSFGKCISLWTELLTGTVPVNNSLLTGTMEIGFKRLWFYPPVNTTSHLLSILR